MSDRSTAGAAVLGLSLALGLIVAGWLVAGAVYEVKASQQVVTVKGLAEREVPANLALWSLGFTTTANDLATLHQRIAEDTEAVIGFLTRQGFEQAEIDRSPPAITDQQNFNNNANERYQAQSVVLIRTEKVEAVQQAMPKTADLVAEGVALNRNYEFPSEYMFTRLNEIKPAMIAEATRNAREAAEQFAKDSGSQVGAIRTANQGYFSIEDRDRLSPQVKRIRVVTTVEYFLED